jgi:hypothetical protein
MMHGNAGDFWVIQEDIEVPDMEKRRPRQAPARSGAAPRATPAAS